MAGRQRQDSYTFSIKLNSDLDSNYFTELTNLFQVGMTNNRLALMGAGRWK
jgi:hypothetical protein